MQRFYDSRVFLSKIIFALTLILYMYHIAQGSDLQSVCCLWQPPHKLLL